MTNVVRHAGASRADVAVEHRPGSLVVLVDDDGHGATGTDGVEEGTAPAACASAPQPSGATCGSARHRSAGCG